MAEAMIIVLIVFIVFPVSFSVLVWAQFGHGSTF